MTRVRSIMSTMPRALDELPPNEPLNADGSSRSRVVDHRKALARRLVAEKLAEAGVPEAEAVQAIVGRFAVSEERAREDLFRAMRTIKEESDRRSPYNRALAERRLLGEIREATSRGQFTAVANLEGKLAEIQGTVAPQEQRLTADVNLSSEMLQLIGVMTPEEAGRLIERQYAKRLTAPPSTSYASDTVGVEVESD